jgi:RNA-binding protein 8A
MSITKIIPLNLHKHTGYLSQNTLVEWETYQEAQSAVRRFCDQDVVGQTIIMVWCPDPFTGKIKTRKDTTDV